MINSKQEVEVMNPLTSVEKAVDYFVEFVEMDKEFLVDQEGKELLKETWSYIDWDRVWEADELVILPVPHSFLEHLTVWSGETFEGFLVGNPRDGKEDLIIWFPVLQPFDFDF
jgi:hypothetical protein